MGHGDQMYARRRAHGGARCSQIMLFALACVIGCGGSDVGGLPACDAAEVQEVARKAAEQSVKVNFALSSFSEVQAESTAAHRTCRVKAKHAASGASIWMKFTVARRPVDKDKKKEAKEPEDELAVVFAPIQ